MIKEICGKVSCDLCDISFTSQYRLNVTREDLVSESPPLSRPICKSSDQVPRSAPRQSDISAVISYVDVM